MFSLLLVCCIGIASSTQFSVWAPHAQAVSIITPSGSSYAMSNGGSGTWMASAPLGSGAQYAFEITSAQGIKLNRYDPLSLAIQGNWSVVVATSNKASVRSRFASTPARVNVMEIHIPSFTPEGTFAGAASKLGYLKQLGITHVELMPVALFRGPAMGWGYNPSGLLSCAEPSMGGAQGLKAFVSAAHEQGLQVVLDVVYNHIDSTTSSNALYQYDGWAGPAGTGIFFYQDSELDAQTLWGPRPNYGNATVSDFLIASAKLWRNEFGIDGFRADSTICIRKPGTTCWTEQSNLDAGWQFLQRLNSEVGGWTTAEDSQGLAAITAPVSSGGAGFSSQWAYRGFFYAFQGALVAQDNSDVNMAQIGALLTSSSEGTRVLFTENHDQASNQNKGRIPAIVDPGGSPFSPDYWAVKKAMLGVAGAVLGHGYSMLFQGQEMLTYAAFDFPTPPLVDWSLASHNKGLVQEVTDLLHLPIDSLAPASLLQVADSDSEKVAVFSRGDSFVCIFNMYQQPISGFELQKIPQDGTWNTVFNGDNTAYFPSMFKGFGSSSVSISNGQGTIDIPEYSVLVLQAE